MNLNNEICKKRLFAVNYERNEQKYYLRSIDNDNNRIIYVKLSHTLPHTIKKKQYLSMRQVVFSVSLEDANDKRSKSLKIVICCEPIFKNNQISHTSTYDSNNNNKKMYIFNSEDSPITIGRQNCTVNLDFSFLSKRNCTIVYNAEKKAWEIYDGNGGRPSTNGTWLTVKSKFEINNDTDFKIGNNIMRIKMVN